MRYKLHYEPLYEYEAISMLKNILNGRSIKDSRNERIARHGSRYKAAITRFFKNAIALENYVGKHVTYNMPGYETTGKQIAAFLFTENETLNAAFADALYFYRLLLQNGIDNKEFALLAGLDEKRFDRYETEGAPPVIKPGQEFFTILDSCPVTDKDKFDTVKLYYNFDMYQAYLTALVAQVKDLILEKWANPVEETAPVMDRIAALIDKNGTAFSHEYFHVTLDDTHDLMLYPSLYNTTSMYSTGYGDVLITFGLHIFEAHELISEAAHEATQTEAFLKCLSDSTKLSIIKLLRNETMYVGQLAEALNCTSANISHHASALLSLDIIYMKKESNRMYLHLNKETIARCFDEAKGLFL